MTGRHRLGVLGVAGSIALLSIGGAALAKAGHHDAGALAIAKAVDARTARAHVHTPHPVHRAHIVLAHFRRYGTHRSPADDQYGNPLEGKLCASSSDNLTFTFNGKSVHDDFLMISNCGEVTVNLGPYQQSNPAGPFRAIDTIFDNSNQCPLPGAGFTLPLKPGDDCVLLIGFGLHAPTDPSPYPPGDYSDTWTFPGDTASLTVHLSGTLPTS